MQVKRILAGFLILLGLASAAQAQERRIRIGKSHGSVSRAYSHGSAARSSIRTSYGRRYAGSRSYRARRIWVPGHYGQVERRVFEAEHFERIWIEPIFGTRYDLFGRRRVVQTCDGYWKELFVPGRWVRKHVRIWRPGYFRRAAH